MATLVPIPGCNATIRIGHYASVAALFAELQSTTGITPKVLNTAETIAAGYSAPVSGGSRTAAEIAAVGESFLSDHYEDNAFGRSAIDLDNHRAFRAALGDARFTKIMNNHGWFNMDLAGNDFSREPWHWAIHYPEDTTTAAGSGSSPFDNQEEEDDMSKNVGIYWTRAADNQQVNAIVNTDSGLFSSFVSADGNYNNSIAAAFGTVAWANVSEGHATKIEADCKLVRARA